MEPSAWHIVGTQVFVPEVILAMNLLTRESQGSREVPMTQPHICLVSPALRREQRPSQCCEDGAKVAQIPPRSPLATWKCGYQFLGFFFSLPPVVFRT